MKVAINGFGRIGRSVFRILDARADVDVVAINDLYDPPVLAYLLRYDTVMGPFKDAITLDDGHLTTARTHAKMLSVVDLEELPWAEAEVDVVVESTGAFRARRELDKHLTAGADRVMLTVPARDKIDYTVVLGVNDDGLGPQHKIISNASCTTNCLAPMAKVLNDSFGIAAGVINTVHAYTNDQRLADVPHTDWRRSRAAAENIIPTSTGAARAVGEVLPELAGRLDGIASRVPVADGSVVDLFVELESSVSTSDVHAAVRSASMGPMLDVLEYADGPIVSSDVIGNPHSSIYDSQFTIVSGGRFVKTLNWYDNEWGYANRVCDVVALMNDW
ncbi:MAG: type I glyceraldehyde-3-phosphate dehydrogenase [Gammaproteobacteria bacterium]